MQLNNIKTNKCLLLIGCRTLLYREQKRSTHNITPNITIHYIRKNMHKWNNMFMLFYF